MSNGKQRKKWVLPAFCNLAGILILLLVILSCLPVTVPKFLGYEIYHVVSGSMEPEIPLGSILYVERVEPVEIQSGDIIAFQRGDSVVTHRVTKNQQVEGKFTTKGDANAEEDMNTVPYAALLGRVKSHYPKLGALLGLYTSSVGKVYVLCFAACGAMLNILAGRIRERRRLSSKGENGTAS
ncbi:signal peptidase I [Hominifimenecus sp. rT4P-3]|uniref:signal peptidase I n=1 Tax=Hominifimenecus sp. rT4P-3 TaxID=3242979 RepID=UPI003DA3A322